MLSNHTGSSLSFIPCDLFNFLYCEKDIMDNNYSTIPYGVCVGGLYSACTDTCIYMLRLMGTC